ncbi:MAG: MotA/TolQ/ExbB proton channel family protein [Sporomusaceae bacterium]|nr:MotA/TolQ/ExbB proton channel family protein [Sporomusaceae bacterium]
MFSLGRSIELFNAGGPIMYLILVCSFTVITIFIERWLYFRGLKPLPGRFAADTEEMLVKGEFDRAARFCAEEGSIAAKVAAAGILSLKQASSRLENVLDAEAVYLTGKLRKNINHLESIVTVAPLLGLLGTVIGMIDSFKVIDVKNGQPLAITGGIGEALVATAFGLCVAILAMAAYSYFNHRIDKIITDIEEVSALIIRNAR